MHVLKISLETRRCRQDYQKTEFVSIFKKTFLAKKPLPLRLFYKAYHLPWGVFV